ncbi:unnamed protein product [Adineta ricciae]|uniref:Ig-like domain-containing protein n=1 Tax=Adineta ricciae TaxID=249248 RepID=A0A814WFY8_ADIRI|nr:unnamed protein product [Adineta ricciae]CAF1409954.1 unnamed protein product [Adineta ricciae]
MIFSHRHLSICSFVLLALFFSSSSATFCSNLTSIDDKDTPCFIEISSSNPVRIRSSSSNIILPCHVARSKRSTVEWWYQDFQKKINIKIYPVYPAVRPTVLRFLTNVSPLVANSNETDILDVSVLLKNVDVDDSGVYRCVVRSWSDTPVPNIEQLLLDDDQTLPSLSYHVELSAPRLCENTFERQPCFEDTRTSSPTIVDAYQSAFLQCIVPHDKLNVFWVVGNKTGNHAVIIDYLITNNHNGDQLRRVFPLSPFDYSIELTIDRNTYERTYSCVIDKHGELEATLFTYIVRTMDLGDVSDKTIQISKSETTIKPSEIEKSSTKLEKILSHDSLTPQQIEELRQKSSQEHVEVKTERSEDKKITSTIVTTTIVADDGEDADETEPEESSSENK